MGFLEHTVCVSPGLRGKRQQGRENSETRTVDRCQLLWLGHKEWLKPVVFQVGRKQQAHASQCVLVISFGEIKITANGEKDPLWEVEIKRLSSRVSGAVTQWENKQRAGAKGYGVGKVWCRLLVQRGYGRRQKADSAISAQEGRKVRRAIYSLWVCLPCTSWHYIARTEKRPFQ